MVLGQIDDDWHKHWESFFLVSLQDIQEVIVLKEAHSSVRNLEMNATNALDDSLEEPRNEMVNLIDLTNLEHFLELSQKERFLDAVGKWPKFE